MMADILCELDQQNYPLELTALTPEEIESYIIGPTNIPKPEDEWEGMPEYINEDKSSYKSVRVHFKTKKDMENFSKVIGQNILETTRSIWFPQVEIEKYMDKYYAAKS
jgi:hypothetical protein